MSDIVSALSKDDFVASFSLDNAPVRGRAVRLGAGALDPILRRHDYPVPVAMLLGEALCLAGLVGSLLKTEGRFIVQAEGDGPVNLLLAEFREDGGLRGYARMKDGAAEAFTENHRLAPKRLLGEGRLAITLDQGGDLGLHQGVVALNGETLAQCAESYFLASEQTETRIRLAVGEVLGQAASWRGAGLLMQRLGRDDARVDADEDWSRATILFDTVTDEEMLDPALETGALLFRLFHEEGARMGPVSALADRCTCSADRLTGILRTFSTDEIAGFIEPDGLLHARCQFCARTYKLPPDLNVQP